MKKQISKKKTIKTGVWAIKETLLLEKDNLSKKQIDIILTNLLVMEGLFLNKLLNENEAKQK